mmetsp:Transcript_511/g.1127  ORF Transcript_511/g.1127 Transcript_511/m.1127 type:complete len:254 (-) Transcript_511:445-1206(-)
MARVRRCDSLCIVERLDGARPLALAQLFLAGGAPQASPLEVTAEAEDGRARLPVGALVGEGRVGALGAPVLGVVVGGRVRADPIRHRLNERRPPLGDGDLARPQRRHVNGEQVVAVDSDRGHAEGDSPRRDAVRGVLVVGVRRDGVAVVAAKEEGRAAVHRSDVERRGDVALLRAALAEVGDRTPLLLEQFHQVGGAIGCGHLLAEVRLDVHQVLVSAADVHRQLAALRPVELVVAALVRSLLNRVAPPEGGA